MTFPFFCLNVLNINRALTFRPLCEVFLVYRSGLFPYGLKDMVWDIYLFLLEIMTTPFGIISL